MRFVVAGQSFEVEHALVERSLEGLLPDPVLEHYVVIGGRRFPPKQVLATVTGLDRADFTTHQARRVLMRLGFVASRTSRDRDSVELVPDDRSGGDGPHHGRQAAALRPYTGKWVALGGPTEVLVAADTPQDVLAWLARHGKGATGIFRVPAGPEEAEGAAPA